MCEKTKDKEKKIEHTSKQKEEEPKSYYYDDAHGYQKYDPEDDDGEIED
ncbi:MAG TPA: hypothetical protein PKY59_16260 [Pyrinomonadaceae bacterium]|nr:hypothetical protein [Pyrinomonadaceae bacterium]